MKNIILITVFMMMTALTVGIIMTLHGREARSVEIKSQLASVMEETVENLMQKKNYEIKNCELFLADFIEHLSMALDTDSEVILKVWKADMEKGILSVEVEEKYKHINGKTGSVTCSKTVIFDQIVEETVQNCEVKFYLNREDLCLRQNCYKVYQVRKGDCMAAPVVREDGFEVWKDENGYLADFTQPVMGEICYYAEWCQ